jgi:hypothetical protein
VEQVCRLDLENNVVKDRDKVIEVDEPERVEVGDCVGPEKEVRFVVLVHFRAARRAQSPAGVVLA